MEGIEVRVWDIFLGGGGVVAFRPDSPLALKWCIGVCDQ